LLELFFLRVYQCYQIKSNQIKPKNESGQYVDHIQTKGLNLGLVGITLQIPFVEVNSRIINHLAQVGTTDSANIERLLFDGCRVMDADGGEW